MKTQNRFLPNIGKFGLILILSFFACSKGPNSAKSSPVAPFSVSPEPQVAKSFLVVSDDGSVDHNRGWKDSGGNIWAEVTRNLRSGVSPDDLEQGCNVGGMTLPAADQLNQLATDLGRGSVNGFNPSGLIDQFDAGGAATVVITSGHTFASSTLDISQGGNAIMAMKGDTGEMTSVPLKNGLTESPVSTLCVAPAKRSQIVCEVRTRSDCSSLITAPGPLAYTKAISKSGNLKAEVNVSTYNPAGDVTLTLDLTDQAQGKAVSKSVLIGSKQILSDSVELIDSQDGEAYELFCAVGGVDLTALIGEACQLLQ